MPENDRDAVAEFIRTKGITRCPTACLVPTQGLVAAADRVALEEHAVARDRKRRAKPLLACDRCGTSSPLGSIAGLVTKVHLFA